MLDPFDSVSEFSRKIISGELSSYEVVKNAIERISTFDIKINAVIFRDFENALITAKEADRKLAKGTILGPLHGIPVTIKEAFDIAGQPTTWGVPRFKNNLAKRDALVVEKLKNAGAIFVGKTNVPYMLSDWQTFNAIYGTTNNPWDLSRSPGGSSGGAAAAIAAGYVPIEVGSDIGGSIRGPAHYCGVYGHKPSFGIVPMDGHTIPGIDVDLDLIVAGPLARYSEDLRVVFNLLVGPSRLNNLAWKIELPERKRNSFKDYRVAIFLEDNVSKVDHEIIQKLYEIGKFLETQGSKVSYKAKPEIDLAEAHDLYLRNLRGTTGALMNDKEFASALRETEGLKSDDKSYWAYVNRGATQDFRSFFSIKRKQHFLRHSWDSFFKEWDIFLCPIAASTAIPHDQTKHRKDRTIWVNDKYESYNDQLFWAGLSIFPYLPSTAFPVGISKNKLPIGIQAIGPYLYDLETIKFAQLMETTYGGFVKPNKKY